MRKVRIKLAVVMALAMAIVMLLPAAMGRGEMALMGQPEPDKNYAPWATAATSFTTGQPLTMLHDGSLDSVWSTDVAPQFPGWITLDLGDLSIATSKISLITWFAQGQAITELDVEYWEDGQWKPALNDVQLNWTTNDTTHEVKDIALPGIVTSKIRLHVQAANTAWGNIAVSDIQWWGVEPPPAVVNVARDLTFTATGVVSTAGIERLTDGELQPSWTAEPVGPDPAILSMDSGDSRLHIGKLTIRATDVQQQGIEELDLEYYDGVKWVTVLDQEPLDWTPAGAGAAQADLIFDPVFAQQLRLRIHEVGAVDRSFAIDEIEAWGYAVKPPTAQRNPNVAIEATVSSSLTGGAGQSLAALHDGQETTRWVSAVGQTFPATIELQFAEEIATGKLTLASAYGQSQGVAKLDLEYWQDGSWTPALEDVSLTWNTNTADAEQADVRFAPVRTTALRVVLKASYSTQGQVTLNEIYVWGTDRTMPIEPPLEPLPPLPEPEMDLANIAGTATVSTTFASMNGYAIGLIANDDRQSTWSSAVGVQLPQTITLDWGAEPIRTGKMTFHTWYGLGQGFTKVDIAYEAAGGLWVNAASDVPLNWLTNDGTIEAIDLTFPEVETRKIRITVKQANTSWGNVSLNELQVWSDQQT